MDVHGLGNLCPELPKEKAAMLGASAAAALSHHHQSPKQLRVQLLHEELRYELSWTPPSTGDIPFLGARRIVVEWGAECVALMVLCRRVGWRPVRRLIDGEAADWLLADDSGAELAVEVSGTDQRAMRVVMAEELKQLDRCREGERRFAFVVRFVEPEAQMVEHEGAQT